jgi:thiol-disulfide isomerase/thioredoxin
MRPVVSALESKYQDRVDFIVVDVATSEGLTLAREYRVTATPTYLFITEDGFTMGSLRGRQEGAAMEEAVEALLSS